MKPTDPGRRELCRLLALGGAGLAFGCGGSSSAPLPPPPPDPPTGDATVVHVHAAGATSWNGEADFWNHVSQPVVDRMVDEGMLELTGEATLADAWRAVLPSYVPGEAIAIKANFNNAFSPGEAGSRIDALAQPVNAVVRGLREIGVREEDVHVYDAVRAVPDRFLAACRYPGVRCFGSPGSAPEAATFDSDDPDAVVAFSYSGPHGIRITDVLIEATYLINMPILKTHDIAGVTLGFKNHFGTIGQPAACHSNVTRAIVDIFGNPHVGAKTVLTIGDGLFGTLGGCCSAPETWATFGGEVPNSLFFSTDPVAIDRVMADLLAEETSLPSNATAYLDLAAARGFGTSDRDAIAYVRREL